MTKKYLTFKQTKDCYEVYYNERVLIGELIVGLDGFYGFHLSRGYGRWESAVLREIADKIDELNAPWEKNINEYFEKEAK